MVLGVRVSHSGVDMKITLAQSLTVLFCFVASAHAVTPPYFEDFESEPLCANSCTSACVLSTTGWLNEAVMDDQDWLVDSGGTGSAGTGPDVDHTLGTGLGQYLYVEASSPCSNQTNVSMLISPPLELLTTSNPHISFWYHMFGADMGTLHVDVLDSGMNLLLSDIIPPLNDNVDLWQQSVFTSLEPFIPQTIHIRLRYVHSGLGFEGDVAVDDFEFFELVIDPIFMDGFED